MFDILKKFFVDDNTKKLKKFEEVLAKINDFESKLSNFSQEEVKNKTEEFKKILKEGGVFFLRRNEGAMNAPS
jgi:preprotein translocase subunit SecA